MRGLRLLFVLIGTLVCSGIASSALGQERRVALVIGIGSYQHAPSLPNPGNDARAIAATLRRLGFDADEQLDLDIREFGEALRNFGVKASQADVALIYYAGHGIQVSGHNYLIPADARLERERDLVYEAMPLNLPLGELAQARKLGILILDACRNNPFVDRLSRTAARVQVGAGLARIDDTPSDTLVALATRADTIAEDGTGQNSPYTAALLEHLQTPGVELSLFFRQVRDTVKAATSNRQEPFIFGSLGATPFYFNPKPANREPVLGSIPPVEALDRGPEQPLRIGRPTDPDDDQLFAQVTGLPRGGSIRIADRLVLIGDYLTPEQLAATTFQGDGSAVGDAGSFDFSVMDNRGGVARGAVRVVIRASNRPPVATTARKLRIVPTALRLEPAVDPDGDPLVATVSAVPEKGRIQVGDRTVRPGDRLELDALDELTFDPERMPPGVAGSLVIAYEDGRGGRAESEMTIEVAAPGETPATDLEQSLWRSVRDTERPERLKAFLDLFPDGSHVGLARQALSRLEGGAKPAPEVAALAPPRASPAAPQGTPQPPPLPAAPENAERGVTAAETFTAVSAAVVRGAPSASAPRIRQLAAGEKVRVLGMVQDSTWYRVALPNGAPGFVHASLLRADPPAQPEQAPPAAVAAVPSGREQAPTTTAAAPEPAGRPGSDPQVAATQPPDAASRTHGKANAFKDCETCPVMIRLKPGSVSLGREGGPLAERPVVGVTLAKPFALGAYEVTVAEWKTCVDEGGCPQLPRMTNATDATPVHNVHWLDADAYVKWLSRKTGQRYRLPSEAEWEYAAKAGTSGLFWWGGASGDFANCADCGGPYERLTPAAVGSFRENPFGLHGMNGGVAEWVADCWSQTHAGASPEGRPREEAGCRQRTLRGGSWRSERKDVTATYRIGYDADVRYFAHGLRVARDLN